MRKNRSKKYKVNTYFPKQLTKIHWIQIRSFRICVCMQQVLEDRDALNKCTKKRSRRSQCHNMYVTAPSTFKSEYSFKKKGATLYEPECNFLEKKKTENQLAAVKNPDFGLIVELKRIFSLFSMSCLVRRPNISKSMHPNKKQIHILNQTFFVCKIFPIDFSHCFDIEISD